MMNHEYEDKPIVALTMGDPAGVGPELCLKVLHHPRVTAVCRPVVAGDCAVLKAVAEALGVALDVEVLPDSAGRDDFIGAGPCVVDLPTEGLDAGTVGRVDAHCGRAAASYIHWSIRAALAGTVDAIATAPINKKSLELAGIPFPGHTEMLAAGCGLDEHDVVMMLTAPEITVTLVTIHVAMDRVGALITPERVGQTIELTAEAMRHIRGREPRLTVCAYNPHGGEQGMFGDIDHRVIEPAVAAARAKGYLIDGPLPADTAFVPSVLAHTDAHVAMYHDQGLIPFKMLAFDHGVNVTLGLPIVRTSVDHGTAFDIARQGKADEGSLLAAVELAVRLIEKESAVSSQEPE